MNVRNFISEIWNRKTGDIAILTPHFASIHTGLQIFCLPKTNMEQALSRLYTRLINFLDIISAKHNDFIRL